MRKRVGALLWMLWVWCGAGFAPALAVEAYMAPPVAAGSLEVTLVPTAGVTPGVPVVAGFGVPFPRGSITVAGLATLRVTVAGTEIPALVTELTPWRHRRTPALDGTSVRVALVQVERSFESLAERQTLTLSWGGAPRLLNRPTRALRAQTHYLVDDGAFPAADNVMEPRVYALLPSTWLSRGVLRGNRALPFETTHPEARDDPAVVGAVTTWPGYTETDRALKNFGYSVVNRDDPAVTAGNRCPFKTAFEPWLYDRPATLFTWYLRSGHFTPLQEAMRNAEFYRVRINASGGFTLNPGDNKYSFNESLAYAFWLSGDASFLPEIQSTANAHNSTQHAWTPGLGFWTERAVAFKLMAHSVAWEIDGSPTRAASIEAIVTALSSHQNGANGQIPATGRIDGGWYHTGAQHGDWDAAAYGGSLWMTALLTDALRRAWVADEGTVIADMVRRSGSFLRAGLRTQVGQYNGATTVAPRYVVAFDGSDFPGTAPLHDEEHALDVAAALAWADYFGALNGPRDPLLAPAVDGVYDTYDRSVNFWTRPNAPASGLTAFRVSPWRKWGWEHRTSDGLAWAAAAVLAGPPDALFSNGFEP